MVEVGGCVDVGWNVGFERSEVAEVGDGLCRVKFSFEEEEDCLK